MSLRRTIYLPGVLTVWDSVLPEVMAYRARALSHKFETVRAGDDTFHGIASDNERRLIDLITLQLLPKTQVLLSFFRQSPKGQSEPHFIHSDAEMGDWTGIYYLTPQPPAGDGTSFYKSLETGMRAGVMTGLSRDMGDWDRWGHVDAVFNRLLLFKGDLFHSRGLFENYGLGDEARLIQVVFGKGPFT